MNVKINSLKIFLSGSYTHPQQVRDSRPFTDRNSIFNGKTVICSRPVTIPYEPGH